jgi:hypothetical protein
MKKILKAWLRKNALTDEPDNYIAMPASIGSVGINDILDQMVSEGMEMKRETVLNIINRYNRTAADMVVSGYNVNTGLVYMRPAIKGVFFGKIWNPEVNSVHVALKQGSYLRTAIAETTVEILGEQAIPLEILSLTDSATGNTDGTLSKGRNAELKGAYLKITGENPDCGITFRNLGTDETIKLGASDIVLNEPSRLLILLPASLVEGMYELTVCTQFTGGGSTLKQPRSVSFETPVSIT